MGVSGFMTLTIVSAMTETSVLRPTAQLIMWHPTEQHPRLIQAWVGSARRLIECVPGMSVRKLSKKWGVPEDTIEFWVYCAHLVMMDGWDDAYGHFIAANPWPFTPGLGIWEHNERTCPCHITGTDAFSQVGLDTL